MTLSRNRIGAGVGLAVLILWLAVRGCGSRREGPEEEGAARVSEMDGIKVVAIVSSNQQRSGIASSRLAAASRREERELFAEVLNQDAKSAGGAVFSVHLPLLSAGDGRIPPLPARVTLPGGGQAETAGGPVREGDGLIYKVPAAGAVPSPGTMLSVSIPVGPEKNGVAVPDSSVVWYEGKAWVYMRRDEEHFSRREFAPGPRTAGGWFAERGFSPGEEIVTSGAQLLLSAEFLSQYEIIEIAE